MSFKLTHLFVLLMRISGTPKYKSSRFNYGAGRTLTVRVGRIELPLSDWQPDVLPLNYTRANFVCELVSKYKIQRPAEACLRKQALCKGGPKNYITNTTLKDDLSCQKIKCVVNWYLLCLTLFTMLAASRLVPQM